MTAPGDTVLSLRKGNYSLEKVRSTLDDFLGPRFRTLDKNRIFLAVEEALVNVFEHTNKDTDGVLEISMSHMADRVHLELKDSGPVFDPTSIPMPDPESLAASGGDGGYGLFLMRSIMHVEHRAPATGGNLLILEKRYPSLEDAV